MKQKVEGIPRNEVALTFHSMDAVISALGYRAVDSVYVGEKTLVVPAETVERYRRLQPVVNEVLAAAELPAEETTTPSREQIIFAASARRTFVAQRVYRAQSLFSRTSLEEGGETLLSFS
jgi:hypothetical protein